MRPKQWTKNVLFMYPALVFDGQLFDPDSFLRVTLGCFLLCMVAGSIYIINDLVDIESDRQHPRKKFRAIPSGQLPVTFALASALVIPLASITVAASYSRWLAIILSGYLLLQIAYSFVLKHIVLIDILTVTAGFVLRVTAGVAVISVRNFSPWLYAGAGLLALFLVVGKRRQELLLLADDAVNIRETYKQYNLPLLDDILRMVTTATLITYVLYTIEAPTIMVANTNLAMLTIPFVLYGLLRYLYLIHVKGEGGAPDEVLLRDRPLQVAILLWGLSFVGLIYVIPRGL
jgi:4-hydroxybenzoate polyprenyltransferase